MAAYRTGSDPIEIGDLWLKVKVTKTQYLLFLLNSLYTSISWRCIEKSQKLFNLQTSYRETSNDPSDLDLDDLYLDTRSRSSEVKIKNTVTDMKSIRFLRSLNNI